MTFYLFIYYYFTINTVPNNYIFLSVYLLKMSCRRRRVMAFPRLKIFKFLPFRPPVCTPAKSHTIPQGIKFELNQ